MTKEHVLQTVLDSGTLPTLSPVASKIVTLTCQEETTVSEIAQLISKDISLSTKLLKVVNSAFYNFPQKIGSVQQAASILGANAIRSLVLSFSFLKIEGSSRQDRFNYKHFWEKSLAAAVCARLITSKLSKTDAEEAFVAGLLQNAGELFLARALPIQYSQVLSSVPHLGEDTIATELNLIGADHSYIGCEVFKAWHFPPSLYRCIRYHHSPSQYTGTDEKVRFIVKVLNLSEILSNIFYAEKPRDLIKAFRLRARSMLNLSDKVIDEIYDGVHLEVHDAARYFELHMEQPRSITDILQEANAELSILNLSYEQRNRELVQAKIRLESLTRELEEKNRLLERLVNFDGLTGVYNHRFFQESLQKELARSKRYERPASLIMADIDLFKNFNDKYGHLVGDAILKSVCDVFKGLLREHDLIARYGGEEFAFILPETDKEQAQAIADRVRQAVEKHRFGYHGSTYNVTISLGVATVTPKGEAPQLKDELIAAADDALFMAKKKGRNQVVVFSGKGSWFRRR